MQQGSRGGCEVTQGNDAPACLPLSLQDCALTLTDKDAPGQSTPAVLSLYPVRYPLATSSRRPGAPQPAHAHAILFASLLSAQDDASKFNHEDMPASDESRDLQRHECARVWVCMCVCVCVRACLRVSVPSSFHRTAAFSWWRRTPVRMPPMQRDT